MWNGSSTKLTFGQCTPQETRELRCWSHCVASMLSVLRKSAPQSGMLDRKYSPHPRYSIGQLNAQLKKWKLAVYSVHSACASTALDSVPPDIDLEPVPRLDLVEQEPMESRVYQWNSPLRARSKRDDWYRDDTGYGNVYRRQQQKQILEDPFTKPNAVNPLTTQGHWQSIGISVPYSQMPTSAPSASGGGHRTGSFTGSDVCSQYALLIGLYLLLTRSVG